jgi:hypothetical protein
MKVFNEYKPTVYAAVASWGASVAIVAARVAELIPANVSSVAFLTIGFGVATSVSISRFRLADAITQVFRVGLTAQLPPTGHKYADELIHHLSTCSLCKAGTTIARRCSRGRDLVHLTLEERHGEREAE